jgi:hypothetical protein
LFYLIKFDFKNQKEKNRQLDNCTRVQKELLCAQLSASVNAEKQNQELAAKEKQELELLKSELKASNIRIRGNFLWILMECEPTDMPQITIYIKVINYMIFINCSSLSYRNALWPKQC